jgi:hypothetical protein
MTKIEMGTALLCVALASGCATNREQPNAASGAAAPISPLNAPAAATKRLVLNMSGPTAVTQAKDWPAFQEEWRATFAEHAKDAGVAFGVQKGDAKSIGGEGTLLQVYVNDYRMVGIGARVFFGVMTGNAYIDAKADYFDLNNGTMFGERLYNTTSSAWGGVFAKMTPQQVDAIASTVFAELSSATPK